MKHLKKVLVPTDLSEHSRRALSYGCWLAAEEQAALLVLHVANDFNAWEWYSEEFVYVDAKPWPVDRILAEASLDLSRFLEANITDLKKVPTATRRVALGPVAERISSVADEEKADLIIMSPRRRTGLRHRLFGSVTDTVARMSPCPVLSIAPALPSAPRRGVWAPLLLPWLRRRTANV